MPFTPMAVWLKQVRQLNGMTQGEFGKLFGYSRSAISMMETDRQTIPPEIVNKARGLLRNFPELPALGQADPNAGDPLYPVGFPRVQIRLFPAVPAGTWAEPMDTEDLVEVDAKFLGSGRFACPIRGDSMLPLLEPGDLAIFQHATDPPIGSIVLARNGEQEATVKQLKHDGSTFILHSLNPRYPAATADSWEAIAFLVGIERNVAGTSITYYNPRGLRPSA